jgi:RNA polymerase sigma-70 factor (ECF subfamily)
MELANGRSKLEELERVITEYQNQLFRFAFYRTGSFADSQDIVQDVFLKLYRDNNHLVLAQNVKFYLYRSISNACVDYHRRNKNRKVKPIDKAVLSVSCSDEDIEQKIMQVEEYCRLQKLLTGLPPEQSEIIRLRFFDSLSFVEIASILQIPVTTVKSRFKYGIDKLKDGVKNSKEVNYGM